MEWVIWDVLIEHRIQHCLILASYPAPDQMIPVTVHENCTLELDTLAFWLKRSLGGGDGYSHVFTK